MQIWVIRLLFILASAVVCYLPDSDITDGIIGFVIASALVVGEIFLHVTPHA